MFKSLLLSILVCVPGMVWVQACYGIDLHGIGQKADRKTARRTVLVEDGCGSERRERNLLEVLEESAPKSEQTEKDDLACMNGASWYDDPSRPKMKEMYFKIARASNLVSSGHKLEALSQLSEVEIPEASDVAFKDENLQIYALNLQHAHLLRAGVYQRASAKKKALKDLESYTNLIELIRQRRPKDLQLLCGGGSAVEVFDPQAQDLHSHFAIITDDAHCVELYKKLNENSKAAALLRIPYVNRSYAALLESRKQKQAAAVRAISKASGKMDSISEKISRIESLIDAKELAQAKQHLQGLLSENESLDSAARLKLADLSQSLGDYKKADELLSKVIKQKDEIKLSISGRYAATETTVFDPQYLQYTRGQYRLESGKYKEAKDDLLAAVSGKRSAKEILLLAKAEIGLGQIGEACSELPKAAAMFFDEGRIVMRDQALWLAEQVKARRAGNSIRHVSEEK